MTTVPFADRPRFDAYDKVLGRTVYAGDVQLPGMLHAMTVPATIARGRIVSVDTERAIAVPGVVRVLTARDFDEPGPPPPGITGVGASPPHPAIVAEIAYRGAPIALVVAETIEAAIEGAQAVEAQYDVAPDFSPLVTSAGAERDPVEDVTTGDASGAMTGAATTIDVEYRCPAQHHNPIELLSTTAVWADGRLTVYEATQGASVVKSKLCRSLRLDPDLVDIKSATVGGGFGQKGGSTQRQTAIIARAAMLTGRPVKMLMPRGQIFHNANFRPLSRHRVRIGADAAGRMIAIQYDMDHQQSRSGQFPLDYHDVPAQLYGVTNYHGTSAHVRIDTNSPGYMRAPHPHPACFAFEGAVDELAYRLDRDPLEFRLAHNTTTDPLTGNPHSSHFLRDCLLEGARRFGWGRRNPAVASMKLADGTQVGWGVACGAYPAYTHANFASLRIGAGGSTRFAVGGHEMGQGIRTIIAALILRELDIDPQKLEIVIGDTSAVPQHLTAGSWGTAGTVPVVLECARKAKAAVAELLAGRTIEGNIHRQLAVMRRPFVDVEHRTLAQGQKPKAFDDLRDSGYALAGSAYQGFTTFSYIAHFVEVLIEARTRRVRVPRVVSIADCGRVISPRTAASQVRGGVVWALGSALREETEVDPRYGGWLNNDLADYVVPVNADIGEIEVGFVDRPDPMLNETGAKGLGEVAMVGAAAAIGNAIYHASGTRIRHMPIRLENLL